jgi:hypothetical protein
VTSLLYLCLAVFALTFNGCMLRAKTGPHQLRNRTARCVPATNKAAQAQVRNAQTYRNMKPRCAFQTMVERPLLLLTIRGGLCEDSVYFSGRLDVCCLLMRSETTLVLFTPTAKLSAGKDHNLWQCSQQQGLYSCVCCTPLLRHCPAQADSTYAQAVNKISFAV